MNASPISLADPQTKRLWDAINRIPADVLEEYLADQIIDEQEVDDITNRIRTMCIEPALDLSAGGVCHKMIRSMVHHAVEHIRHHRAAGQAIEAKLCDVTMQDIRQAMGSLLASGQIKLGTQHLGRETHAFDMGDIPAPPDKPEDDEEQSA